MASTLNIALQNQSTSSSVYAYITGLAIQNNSRLFLLQSDGKTYYYPVSPSSGNSPLAQNCAIHLGNPGSTVNVTVPQLAGARIWFSIGSPLVFYLNPGPALVSPSLTNPSDPNYNLSWDFCEFTFNNAGLYANISYVDFVCLPVSLSLTNMSGVTTNVPGMPANGLATVSSGLQAQTASDKQGWGSLIVTTSNGQNLRVLSPNNGIVRNNTLFLGYFEPYVTQVWERFTSSSVTINTPGFGSLQGQVSGQNQVTVGGEVFNRPTTADIFSCSTGPFAAGSDAKRNNLIPLLAAAFNRSTFLNSPTQPAPLSAFYKETITNHYSRIVHAANVDGRGYAFPYDDVSPEQSGEVNDPNPGLFTVAVGGGNTQWPVKAIHTELRREKGGQAAAEPQDEKALDQAGHASAPPAATAVATEATEATAVTATTAAAKPPASGPEATRKPKTGNIFRRFSRRFIRRFRRGLTD